MDGIRDGASSPGNSTVPGAEDSLGKEQGLERTQTERPGAEKREKQANWRDLLQPKEEGLREGWKRLEEDGTTMQKLKKKKEKKNTLMEG